MASVQELSGARFGAFFYNTTDDRGDAFLLFTLSGAPRQAFEKFGALSLIAEKLPDVLISDIGLPDVDGYEFIRRVRALPPERGGNIPAIALTAFARSEDRIRTLRAGFVVHVSKLADPSELIATVASVAGRGDAQSK